MSNQILLWMMIILPWLSLFFMKKQEIRMYMPAAIFTTVTTILIGEVLGTLKMYTIKETAYPLKSLAIVYGLNPVVSMWILKFTFGRFWLFSIVEIVFNIAFAYFFMGYFMEVRGIIDNITITPFLRTIIAILNGLIIYAYQKWQSKIFSNVN